MNKTKHVYGPIVSGFQFAEFVINYQIFISCNEFLCNELQCNRCSAHTDTSNFGFLARKTIPKRFINHLVVLFEKLSVAEAEKNPNRKLHRWNSVRMVSISIYLSFLKWACRIEFVRIFFRGEETSGSWKKVLNSICYPWHIFLLLILLPLLLLQLVYQMFLIGFSSNSE